MSRKKKVFQVLTPNNQKTNVFNAAEGYLSNGSNNLYPEEAEAVKNGSVTARSASRWFTRMLIGKGFDHDGNQKLISSDLSFHEFAKEIAEDIADNLGFFVHAEYNMECEVIGYDVLPFWSCRLGFTDSQGYTGKILYCDDWSNPINIIEYDCFNPKKEVVAAQIERDGGIRQYKGQICYVNLMKKYAYPLHRLDPVFKEAENEQQISVYTNTILTKGFYGKTVFITPPMVDDNLDPDASEEDLHELKQQETERDSLHNTLKEFVGPENSGGAMIWEMEFEGDIDKAVLIKNIESKIDPDIFNNIKKVAKEDILISYNNLPIILVEPASGSSLGNSGTTIYEAKLLFQENTEPERETLESYFNYFWSFHVDFDNIYYQIIPMVEPRTNIMQQQ